MEDVPSIAMQGTAAEIVLTHHQATVLLSTMVLCTISVDQKDYRLHQMPPVSNFIDLFGQQAPPEVAKLTCYLHYFNRMAIAPPSKTATVTFSRHLIEGVVGGGSGAGGAAGGAAGGDAGGDADVGADAGTNARDGDASEGAGSSSNVPSAPAWGSLRDTLKLDALPLQPAVMTGEGLIEDANPAEYIHADFANEYIGGGVLCGGCVQEEILFAVAPLYTVTLMLFPRMLEHESIVMTGCEVFSATAGNAKY